MKRTIWMALAALLLAVPAANAQKVNESAFLAKIQKSDADIADAKKNIKASTWINRGKLFCDIAAEPTKNLFINMDAAMLKLAVGEPASTGSAEVGGQACETWEYPYFTAYIANNKLLTWKQKKAIVADAPAQAIEAYNKAYELDPKQGEKIKAGLKQVSDFCSQVGNAGLDSGFRRGVPRPVRPRLRAARSRVALLCRLPAHHRRCYASRVVRHGCRLPQ